MTGRIWLDAFSKGIKDKEKNAQWQNRTEWTDWLSQVLDKAGEDIGCEVVRRRPGNKSGKKSQEYLGIDVIFLDGREHDGYPLPMVVVETENEQGKDRIAYCLWKLLVVRSQVRVLICSQKNDGKVLELKEHLEDIIWRYNLMQGAEGEVLVIIGSEARAGTTWNDYFGTFEWRSDTLSKVDGVFR